MGARRPRVPAPPAASLPGIGAEAGHSSSPATRTGMSTPAGPPGWLPWRLGGAPPGHPHQATVPSPSSVWRPWAVLVASAPGQVCATGGSRNPRLTLLGGQRRAPRNPGSRNAKGPHSAGASHRLRTPERRSTKSGLEPDSLGGRVSACTRGTPQSPRETPPSRSPVGTSQQGKREQG